MKTIKTFENFSSMNYLWNDASFWIEELYPEEICFLSIYSKYIEDLRNKKNNEIPLFKVKLDCPNEVDLESGDYNEEKASTDFEMYYSIPSKKGVATLSFEVSASGYFTPVRTYGYYDPPEGGDPILDDINIESAYYLDSEHDLDADFSANTYNFKSEFITKKMLMDIMVFVAEDRIVYDQSKVDVKIPSLPHGLINKCEEIRGKNPSVTKGYDIISRFNIK
jgi:hypothetical protein